MLEGVSEGDVVGESVGGVGVDSGCDVDSGSSKSNYRNRRFCSFKKAIVRLTRV